MFSDFRRAQRCEEEGKVLQEMRNERWIGMTHEGSRNEEDTPLTSPFCKTQL